MKRRYDVEFQLADHSVWLRVNDIIADSEDESIEMAYHKLHAQIGLDARKYKHWIEIVNVEDL